MKNCVRPSERDGNGRTLLMTRQGSPCPRRLSVFCNFSREKSFSRRADVFLYLLFYRSSPHMYTYICTYVFPASILSLSRACHPVILYPLSLPLSYRASFVLLFSLTGTLSPFGSGRHPSSEATKSRHLLKSSSRNITTAVAPFNIDEGVTTDGSGTRCRVSNIHSHASALNFTLFVMIRILFLCPRSIFGSILIPQISSNEMGNFEI